MGIHLVLPRLHQRMQQAAQQAAQQAPQPQQAPFVPFVVPAQPAVPALPAPIAVAAAALPTYAPMQMAVSTTSNPTRPINKGKKKRVSEASFCV